ncbi:MaoC/PaaZ C-terminal domain-containing protein [Halobellus sp. GM3]|uniref:MaoC/PaaZ C-terminal domain-containing protein n=1 Tax=Halobellus sp. GM3 TaxID=3458410 RepID=UPI00403DF5FD
MRFSDLSVGDSFQTDTHRITEDDIESFADITGDHNWIHVDEQRAADGPYGRRIAHGPLVIGIMMGLVVQEGIYSDAIIALYGMDNVRFIEPVKLRDEIYVEMEITDLERQDEDSGLVTTKREAVNSDDETVLVCSTIALLSDESP